MSFKRKITPAPVYLLLILIGLYLSFRFIRNKIDTWILDRESHALFQNIFPELLNLYENGGGDQALNLIRSIDPKKFTSTDKYKIYLFQAAIYKKQNYLLNALKMIRLAQEYQQTQFSQTLEGMILEGIGEKQLAQVNYQRAIEASPNYYPAHEKLADMHYLDNNLEESIRYLKEAESHSLKPKHTTANNVILLKKIFLEYLKSQSSLSHKDLDQMENFQETRFLGFIFILQGLINWEKNETEVPTWSENKEFNYFKKAVRVAVKEDKIYYQLFLDLLSFHLDDWPVSENKLKQLLEAFPEGSLFSAIVHETLGDHALRKGSYTLSHNYYKSVKNPAIKNEPIFNYRIQLAGIYQNPERSKRRYFQTSDPQLKITSKLSKKSPSTAVQHSSEISGFTTTYTHFSSLIAKINQLELNQSWKEIFFLLKSHLAEKQNPPLFLIKKAADSAFQAQKYLEAEKFYQKAILQGGSPKMMAKIYNNLAKIWLVKKNKRKASHAIFLGLKAYSLPTLYYNRSLIQKSEGNFIDCFYSLKKANSILSKESDVKLAARIYLEMSFILTYARVYQRANYYLAKARKFDLNYVKQHEHERKNFLRQNNF